MIIQAPHFSLGVSMLILPLSDRTHHFYGPRVPVSEKYSNLRLNFYFMPAPQCETNLSPWGAVALVTTRISVPSSSRASAVTITESANRALRPMRWGNIVFSNFVGLRGWNIFVDFLVAGLWKRTHFCFIHLLELIFVEWLDRTPERLDFGAGISR